MKLLMACLFLGGVFTLLAVWNLQTAVHLNDRLTILEASATRTMVKTTGEDALIYHNVITGEPSKKAPHITVNCEGWDWEACAEYLKTMNVHFGGKP